MTNTKPEYTVGQVVGWRGERCEVSYISRWEPKYLEVRRPCGVYERVYTSQLTDPPPLPDHVQQAAEAMVEAGFLTNPHAAIFGRDES